MSAAHCSALRCARDDMLVRLRMPASCCACSWTENRSTLFELHAGIRRRKQKAALTGEFAQTATDQLGGIGVIAEFLHGGGDGLTCLHRLIAEIGQG